jgi:hypothetical protein
MKILHLPFLGDRDYVNGATIFDAIIEYVEPEFPFTIRFNSLIRGAVEIAPAAGRRDAKGVLSFSSEGKVKALGLFEVPASEMKRLPYDEAPIFRACQVDGDEVLSRAGEVSTISRLIVMYKALMAKKFPDAKGKWLFTGVTATSWPQSASELRLQFVSSAGTRMVKSRAFVDGREVAQILFSLAA